MPWSPTVKLCRIFEARVLFGGLPNPNGQELEGLRMQIGPNFAAPAEKRTS